MISWCQGLESSLKIHPNQELQYELGLAIKKGNWSYQGHGSLEQACIQARYSNSLE